MGPFPRNYALFYSSLKFKIAYFTLSQFYHSSCGIHFICIFSSQFLIIRLLILCYHNIVNSYIVRLYILYVALLILCNSQLVYSHSSPDLFVIILFVVLYTTSFLIFVILTSSHAFGTVHKFFFK